MLCRLSFGGQAHLALDTSVVKCDIKVSEGCHGLIHKRLHIGFAADIRFDEEGLSPDLFNGLDDLLPFTLAAPPYHHLCSSLRKREGSRLADSRCSTSNDRNFV